MCSDEMKTLLGVIKFAINLIKFIIPIILIVLGVIDLTKAVTAGDEKEQKAAQKKFLNRVIYALIVFLVPTIVMALFGMLPSSFDQNGNAGWVTCWKEVK